MLDLSSRDQAVFLYHKLETKLRQLILTGGVVHWDNYKRSLKINWPTLQSFSVIYAIGISDKINDRDSNN